MTTRGVINSNFYQIVNVDVDGNPTDVKPEYLPNVSNVANANYANFAGNAFSVNVANVVGIGNIATVNLDGNSGNILYGNGVFSSTPDVGNANSANFANYSNFAGNAYSVDVGNVVGIGNIATINLDGNSGNILYGNGVFSAVPDVGNANSANFANYANFSGEAFSVTGSNVVGEVANANYSSYSNNAINANYANFSGNAYSVSGSNVIGIVANANYAAYAGNFSGNVGNANYANFAGNAFSVSGSNVVGVVANATYATTSGTSYNVAGGNVVGEVANANYATYSGSSFSVSGSNVVGQVANALVSGTVYSNSQPNITSVGTLTSLSVGGNISATGNVSGAYYIGDGSYLTGIGNLAGAEGYWGSFYSNATQTAANTTSAFAITLNNSDPNNNGVYISSNSHVNFTYAGVYNFQFSVQILNTQTNPVEASFWLRKNGTDVVDSRGTLAVADKQGAQSGQSIVSWNYMLKLNANDYLEMYWQTEDSTHVQLEFLPAGTTPTTPASPSIIVTAQQVTSVQAATLSGSLTGNLLGNGYGLTSMAFIDAVGNISGNVFTGNANGLYNIIGANVIGYVANATHANISDIANLAYSVSGSNVTSQVANANYATYSGETFSVTGSNVVGQVGNALIAGTVYTNAQPNITSVGTLTVLNSSGNVTAPYFIGNVVGNISGNIVVPGLQWDVLYNDGGNAGASDNLQFNASSNVLTVVGNVVANYYTGNGSLLTSINGANVSNVANANYSNFSGNAYSVNVGNVVGIGNIATLNLDGNSGNILYGNGVFSAVPNISNVANANYANYAGTAYSVSGSNVSGQVANALIAGTVYTNAQPNITQVGTLTSLNVATSILPTSNLIYDLGNSTNRFRDLYLSGNSIYLDGQTISANSSGIAITGTLSGDGGALSNITGANVTGVVANANFSTYSNYASFAGNAYSVDGANVTGVVANANYSVYSGTAYSVSGANVSGTVANATYAIDAGNAYNVSGANVSGVVANANYAAYAGNFSGVVANANFANFAGEVVNSSQPNITSVGTLTSLTVSGNINSNNSIAANIVSANSFIAATQNTATTPGGTLSLTYLSPQNQQFTGSSIFDLILPNPSTVIVGAYWYVNNNSTNNIVVKNYAGTTLYTVLPGANTKFIYTGSSNWDYHSFLPNSMSASLTTANLANLVVANYFSGNGSLLTGITVSSVANANYANFAGNAYSVDGANVVGTVANANYAAYSGNSYSVSGSNVSGQVANALIAGTVYTNSQPNITSVGTLSTLSVTGNISTSNYYIGNGYYLTGITGGGGSPGGSNTYVQFNDGSTFGGNAGLTFDKTNGNLTVGGNINIGANIVDSANNWSLKYTPVVGFTPANLVLDGPGGDFYSGGGISPTGGFTGTNFNVTNINAGNANISTQLVTTNIEASTVLTDNSGNINTKAIFNFGAYNGFTPIGPGTIYYSNTSNTFSITSANSITIAPTGNLLLGSNAKVKITGGTSGYVLSTDGASNLSWVAQSGGGSSETDFAPSFLLGGM